MQRWNVRLGRRNRCEVEGQQRLPLAGPAAGAAGAGEHHVEADDLLSFGPSIKLGGDLAGDGRDAVAVRRHRQRPGGVEPALARRARAGEGFVGLLHPHRRQRAQGVHHLPQVADAVDAGAEPGQLFHRLIVRQLGGQGAEMPLQRAAIVVFEPPAGLDAFDGIAAAFVEPGHRPLFESLDRFGGEVVEDRDQVGGDVGAEVAGLGLGDRQRSQRSAAQLGGELCGPFEQAGMNVEGVAGVGLAARGPAQQQ